MSVTVKDLQIAHAGLETALSHGPEPEPFKALFRETADRIEQEIDRIKAADTDPPPWVIDPETQKASMMWAALRHRLSGRFRWVMDQARYDRLAAEAKTANPRAWMEAPSVLRLAMQPEPPEVPAYMFGIPIRIDEHATNLMLELRS